MTARVQPYQPTAAEKYNWGYWDGVADAKSPQRIDRTMAHLNGGRPLPKGHGFAAYRQGYKDGRYATPHRHTRQVPADHPYLAAPAPPA